MVQILILFQEGNRDSEVQQLDMLNALEDVSRKVNLATLPVKVSALPVTSVSALDARLATLRASALFVLHGTWRFGVGHFSTLSQAIDFDAHRQHKLRQAGAWYRFFRIRRPHPARSQLAAARAEGADLDASLLRVAEVYR